MQVAHNYSQKEQVKPIHQPAILPYTKLVSEENWDYLEKTWTSVNLHHLCPSFLQQFMLASPPKLLPQALAYKGLG
jgi:hypothetical protein